MSMKDLTLRRIHGHVVPPAASAPAPNTRVASIQQLRDITASIKRPTTAAVTASAPQEPVTAASAVKLDGDVTLPCPRDKVPMIRVLLAGDVPALFCASCRSTTALESPC